MTSTARDAGCHIAGRSLRDVSNEIERAALQCGVGWQHGGLACDRALLASSAR
jgi:hypothetical protein